MSNELALAVVALMVALWAWARVEVTLWQDRRAVVAMEAIMAEELSRPADYRRIERAVCNCECHAGRKNLGAERVGP